MAAKLPFLTRTTHARLVEDHNWFERFQLKSQKSRGWPVF